MSDALTFFSKSGISPFAVNPQQTYFGFHDAAPPAFEPVEKAHFRPFDHFTPSLDPRNDPRFAKFPLQSGMIGRWLGHHQEKDPQVVGYAVHGQICQFQPNPFESHVDLREFVPKSSWSTIPSDSLRGVVGNLVRGTEPLYQHLNPFFTLPAKYSNFPDVFFGAMMLLTALGIQFRRNPLLVGFDHDGEAINFYSQPELPGIAKCAVLKGSRNLNPETDEVVALGLPLGGDWLNPFLKFSDSNWVWWEKLPEDGILFCPLVGDEKLDVTSHRGSGLGEEAGKYRSELALINMWMHVIRHREIFRSTHPGIALLRDQGALILNQHVEGHLLGFRDTSIQGIMAGMALLLASLSPSTQLAFSYSPELPIYSRRQHAFEVVLLQK